MKRADRMTVARKKLWIRSPTTLVYERALYQRLAPLDSYGPLRQPIFEDFPNRENRIVQLAHAGPHYLTTLLLSAFLLRGHHQPSVQVYDTQLPTPTDSTWLSGLPNQLGSRRCEERKWDWPRTATDGTILQWPQVAVTRTAAIFVGNNSALTPEGDLSSDVFVAVDDAGKRIGKPAGDYQFLLPKVVADGRDRIHMVWGEAENPPGTRDDLFMPRITRLLYAYYESSGWSLPSEIFRAENIRWHGTSAAMTIDDANRLHIVLLAGDRLKGISGTVHLYGNGDQWHTDVLDEFPAYITLAARGEDLFLGLVASDTKREGDRNSVYIMRATGPQYDWGPPVMVQQSGRFPALDPFVFPSSDGRLHALWMQSVSGYLSGETLRHAISADDGSTWSVEPNDLVLPPNADKVSVVIDSCDVIHVAAEFAQPNAPVRSTVFYAQWYDNRWQEQNPALPVEGQITATAPWLGSGPDGKVVLAWTTISPNATGSWMLEQLRFSVLK